MRKSSERPFHRGYWMKFKVVTFLEAQRLLQDIARRPQTCVDRDFFRSPADHVMLVYLAGVRHESKAQSISPALLDSIRKVGLLRRFGLSQILWVQISRLSGQKQACFGPQLLLMPCFHHATSSAQHPLLPGYTLCICMVTQERPGKGLNNSESRCSSIAPAASKGIIAADNMLSRKVLQMLPFPR